MGRFQGCSLCLQLSVGVGNGLEADDADCFGLDIVEGVDIVDDEEVDLFLRGLEGGGGM